LRAVHHGSVLVVSVHGNDPDMLQRLGGALEDVVHHGESVIIDLSELTLAPRSSVMPFLEKLTTLADRSPTGVVVVADRLSARRALNRLLRTAKAAIVPSPEAALRLIAQGLAPTRIPLQPGPPSADRLSAPSDA
jgi:hypothetical protein